jgi:hypothetical protein
MQEGLLLAMIWHFQGFTMGSADSILQAPLLILKVIANCHLLKATILEIQGKGPLPCLQWFIPLGPWQTAKHVCVTIPKSSSRSRSRMD